MLIPNHLLPIVDGKYFKQGLGFQDLQDKYCQLPMQPLQITGHLINGYIPSSSNGAVHLDGILSSAVFAAHPCFYRMPHNPTIVPLPLQALWQSDDGVILYASSDFVPDEQHKGQEYWHKRYPADKNEWVRDKKLNSKGVWVEDPHQMNAKTTAGRYKDYRVPVDVRIANNLSAICIGNQAEIERLLSFVTHVGKKSSQGFGRIAKWEIKPISATVNDVIANRPVPVESQLKAEGKLRHATWTSPYWFMGWAKECYV